MKRTILALVAGFATWMVVATVLDLLLRAGIPGYRSAEPALDFTLQMKIARLLLGALSSLAAGAAAALIAPSRRWLPWVLGLLVLATFIPAHIRLWTRFPVWYHLTFLVTLVPLVALGAVMARCLSTRNSAGG